jgi:hypothetical protein
MPGGLLGDRAQEARRRQAIYRRLQFHWHLASRAPNAIRKWFSLPIDRSVFQVKTRFLRNFTTSQKVVVVPRELAARVATLD